MEEELLLPVYQCAGRILGGPIKFLTGEHQRLLAQLAGFAETIKLLKHSQTNLDREVIRLFDAEAAFKSLMQHHDQRERNILYPKLDEVTEEVERATLLEECRARQDWVGAEQQTHRFPYTQSRI